MTEAMPFLQKTILLSYDPRSFTAALPIITAAAARKHRSSFLNVFFILFHAPFSLLSPYTVKTNTLSG